MSKVNIPETIKNDKMYQFINKVNDGINGSIALYQSGKENAEELAKNLVEFGKQLSSYVSTLSIAQKEKFTAMTKYVNAVNPVIKKDQAFEVQPKDIKILENNALKAIESTKKAASKSIAKTNNTSEVSIGR